MQFRDGRRSCVVIASGPSAGEANLDLVAGWPTLTVNDAYRLSLQATGLYAADPRWWEHHGARVRQDFRGECWTQDEKTAKALGLNWIECERRPGLSTAQGVIRSGGVIGNSGAQAINLAFLLGARRLILVGFDMNDHPGPSHFFGEHPKGLNYGTKYRVFAGHMAEMARDLAVQGVEVINCSLKSGLNYWPKRTLEAALGHGLKATAD